jgi:hypothetical protein
MQPLSAWMVPSFRTVTIIGGEGECDDIGRSEAVLPQYLGHVHVAAHVHRPSRTAVQYRVVQHPTRFGELAPFLHEVSIGHREALRMYLLDKFFYSVMVYMLIPKWKQTLFQNGDSPYGNI